MKKMNSIPFQVGLKKILLIMRMTTIIVFALSMQLYAKSYAQFEKINLKVNSNLKEVFEQVEKVSDYRFVLKYDQSILDKKIDVNYTNEQIDRILDDLLKDTGFTYKVIERYIAIVPIGELNTVSQQQKSVSGKVADITGVGLPGASVVIKGTIKGTITDVNGNYSLANIPMNGFLQFSFMGMKSQEAAVGNNTTINVTLVEETVGLDEVVAIGYGTSNREKITSSITQVNASELKSGVTSNPIELIKGKVPGLSIINQAGNDPNATPQVNLRGIGTISASSGPLVIIDGIYSTIADLNILSSNDVESFNILKDGASTAIYGTRGSNGVIIVKTKTGKSERTNIDYSSYYFTETPSSKPEMLNASQYVDLLRTQGYPSSETDKGSNTYWLDQLLQNKISSFHGLSFSKSQENSSIRISLGQKNHEGLAIDTYNKTTNFRLNYNQTVLDKVEFNAIVGGSRSNQKFTNYNAFDEALKYDPTAPVYNEDGTFYELTGVGASNPLALIKQTDNSGITSRFTGSLEGNIEIIPELKITATGSSSIKNIDNSFFEQIDSRNSQISGIKGNATKYSESSMENVFEFLTNYNFKFGSHEIKYMGGYSFIENEKSSSYLSNSNFLTNSFGANNIGAGSFIKDGRASMESTKEKSRLIAFFGRMNYFYKSKYLFNASLRREGASVFGQNNKWGWFPAVSAGWRMSEEDFFEPLTFINQLKLRAGYGVTGRSQGIPLYQSLSRIGYSGNAFFNGQWTGSYGPIDNANPNLRWEKTKEFNFGIDYSIFKNRVIGAMDVYDRLTVDLLGNFTSQTPPSINPNIFANVGTIRNKGVEFAVSIKAIEKEKFGLTLNLTYSHNNNKVVSLSNDQFKADSIFYGDYGNVSSSLFILAKGLPVGTFYGFKANGIDTNGKWVFEDQNGDGKIEENVDFTTIGNGLPKHLFSFTTNFTYGNYYLNLYFVGAAGLDVFNAKRLWYENTSNSPSNYFASILTFPNNELDDRLRFSSYYLEKGDYLRLDNVTFGYNFKNIKFFKLIGVYFTATNILNITGYSGLDPEVGSGTDDGLTPGWDKQSFYPRSSTYQLGINVNF